MYSPTPNEDGKNEVNDVMNTPCVLSVFACTSRRSRCPMYIFSSSCDTRFGYSCKVYIVNTPKHIQALKPGLLVTRSSQ